MVSMTLVARACVWWVLGFLILLVDLSSGAEQAAPRSASEPAGAVRPAWPSGRVVISSVDTALETMTTAVLDELERRTLVRVIRQKGGLTIRAARSTPDAVAADKELCCFDPAGGLISKRQLARALLGALGVDLSGVSLARVDNPPSSALIKPLEAEAVNELYADEMLPALSALPAPIDIGMWMLANDTKPSEWSNMIEGRGRRVVAGAVRWAQHLHSAGHLVGLVGALPTFVFKGNKVEVVLLGPESAEFAPGSTVPRAALGEGLGSGIRRVTNYARGLQHGKRGGKLEFAGGVPTYLGDGSALLLRSAVVEVASMADFGETLDSVIRKHRSAVAWAQASRWAQGQQALLGLPTFVTSYVTQGQNADSTLLRRPSNALEVLLLRGSGIATLPMTQRSVKTIDGDKGGLFGLSPLMMELLILWGTVFGCAVGAFQLKRMHATSGMSRAERDLERMVNSL